MIFRVANVVCCAIAHHLRCCAHFSGYPGHVSPKSEADSIFVSPARQVRTQPPQTPLSSSQSSITTCNCPLSACKHQRERESNSDMMSVTGSIFSPLRDLSINAHPSSAFSPSAFWKVGGNTPPMYSARRSYATPRSIRRPRCPDFSLRSSKLAEFNAVSGLQSLRTPMRSPPRTHQPAFDHLSYADSNKVSAAAGGSAVPSEVLPVTPRMTVTVTGPDMTAHADSFSGSCTTTAHANVYQEEVPAASSSSSGAAERIQVAISPMSSLQTSPFFVSAPPQAFRAPHPPVFSSPHTASVDMYVASPTHVRSTTFASPQASKRLLESFSPMALQSALSVRRFVPLFFSSFTLSSSSSVATFFS